MGERQPIVQWSPHYASQFVLGGQDLRLFQVAVKHVPTSVPSEDGTPATDKRRVFRLMNVNVDVQQLKCLQWCPSPANPMLLAAGQATGVVSLVSFRSPHGLDVEDVTGGSSVVKSFVPKYSRPCNAVAWEPLRATHLAAGLDKVRSGCCTLIWDVTQAGLGQLSRVASDAPGYSYMGTGAGALGTGASAETVAMPYRELSNSEATMALAWVPRQPSCLATGTGFKWLRIYDLRGNASAPLSVSAHPKAVHGVVFNPFNDQQLATFSEDGLIKVWDTRGLRDPTVVIKTGSRAVSQVAWSPVRAGLLASIARDEPWLALWDVGAAAEVSHPFLRRFTSEPLASFSWQPPATTFPATAAGAAGLRERHAHPGTCRVLTATWRGALEDLALQDTVPVALSPQGELSYGMSEQVATTLASPDASATAAAAALLSAPAAEMDASALAWVAASDVADMMLLRAQVEYSVDVVHNQAICELAEQLVTCTPSPAMVEAQDQALQRALHAVLRLDTPDASQAARGGATAGEDALRGIIRAASLLEPPAGLGAAAAVGCAELWRWAAAVGGLFAHTQTLLYLPSRTPPAAPATARPESLLRRHIAGSTGAGAPLWPARTSQPALPLASPAGSSAAIAAATAATTATVLRELAGSGEDGLPALSPAAQDAISAVFRDVAPLESLARCGALSLLALMQGSAAAGTLRSIRARWRGFPVLDGPARRLLLRIAGWSPALRGTEVDAVINSAQAVRDHARAAALALFHCDAARAVLLLREGAAWQRQRAQQLAAHREAVAEALPALFSAAAGVPPSRLAPPPRPSGAPSPGVGPGLQRLHAALSSLHHRLGVLAERARSAADGMYMVAMALAGFTPPALAGADGEDALLGGASARRTAVPTGGAGTSAGTAVSGSGASVPGSTMSPHGRAMSPAPAGGLLPSWGGPGAAGPLPLTGAADMSRVGTAATLPHVSSGVSVPAAGSAVLPSVLSSPALPAMRMRSLAATTPAASDIPISDAPPLWRSLCLELLRGLHGQPYLQAVCLFVACIGGEPAGDNDLIDESSLRSSLTSSVAAGAGTPTGAQHARLGDDAAVALESVLYLPGVRMTDKLAFSARFLPDRKLTAFVQNAASLCAASGSPEGMVLTGLSDAGVDVLQRFVDRTGDVQTAALAGYRVLAAGSLSSGSQVSVERWLHSYRDVLNRWRLWRLRACLDVHLNECAAASAAPTATAAPWRQRLVPPFTSATLVQRRPVLKHPDAGDSAAEGAEQPINAASQIYARCNFCGHSLSLNSLLRAANAKWLMKQSAKVIACPSCSKPLPRCAICLLPMGSLNPFVELQFRMFQNKRMRQLAPVPDGTATAAAAAAATATAATAPVAPSAFASFRAAHIGAAAPTSPAAAARPAGAASALSDTPEITDVPMPRCRVPFEGWWCWCQRCKHGGHSAHMAVWFTRHSVCPVADCDCACGELDGALRQLQQQQQLLQQQQQQQQQLLQQQQQQQQQQRKEEELEVARRSLVASAAAAAAAVAGGAGAHPAPASLPLPLHSGASSAAPGRGAWRELLHG